MRDKKKVRALKYFVIYLAKKIALISTEEKKRESRTNELATHSPDVK